MVAVDVEGVVNRGVAMGKEVGVVEVYWWRMLCSSSSCHCSVEGSPSSVIPAWISYPPGIPWEAEKLMMGMACSSSSLRDCTVFTPAPVK